jgi:predicted alpha-1,2-mannosidase
MMIKRSLLCIAVLLLFAVMCGNAQTRDVARYVDPFIGTGGHGHTFPGATTPFGMIQLSPDCDTKNGAWDWCSGYHYSDSTMMGFSHNHLSGTGWADLGDILLMPTVGQIKMQPGSKQHPEEGYRSYFSHKNETAQPGYYQVFLKTYGVNAELTASQRVGFHKYTFPATNEANIIIDPVHKIFGSTFHTMVNVVDNRHIRGYCYSEGWGGKRFAYFVAEFSKPFASYGVYEQGKMIPNGNCAVAADAKAWVRFTTTKDEAVEVKVALSPVSFEGAEANFEAEADNVNFDQALTNARAEWAKVFAKFEVEGGTDVQKKLFYTSVYHSFIAPNLYMDVNGDYVAAEKNMNTKWFTNYSTYSYWDGFRTEHPLLTIVDQKHTREFVNSLISRYTDRKDHLPIWELCGYDNFCMLGYHGVSLIWDAISKGVDGIDPEKAFATMKDASLTDKMSGSNGGGGLHDYIRLGYVPCEQGASVSEALEYAYDDFCVAQLAEKLGKKDDAKEYTKRSLSFVNQFNPELKHFWPRYKNGQFMAPFELNDWKKLQPHWISGNIWAYDFFAPQAVDTLIALYGGKKAFEEKLDRTFTDTLKMVGEQHVDISGFVGSLGFGDEPGHEVPYLYNYADAPAKTQKMVAYLRNTMYAPLPDGVVNNEDCGQMSAWYIFSSLGFYPVCPGKPVYDLGTPLFPKVSLHLENGKTFTIIAHNVSDKNIYVRKMKLNGVELNGWQLKHSDIMQGGVLEFFMGKSN